MPRLELFVVSEDVAVDQTTNRVSTFNILEQVATPGFPTLLAKAAALSLWIRDDDGDDGDSQVLLRVILPGGQVHEYPQNFHMRANRHRAIIRLQGLPITEPGRLVFEVLLNGHHAASHTVDVVAVADPDAA